MVRKAITLFLFCFLILSSNSVKANAGPAEQDIPQRCKDNSVTDVSCNNVETDDSLLPHPDDCELFYYCVSPDHDPICRQCPAQLHFNPIKHVCDTPERAGCATESP